MKPISRRTFAARALGSLAALGLMQSRSSGELPARTTAPINTSWINRLNKLADDVKQQRLRQVDWQQQVESLLSTLEPTNVLRSIGIEQFSKAGDSDAGATRRLPIALPSFHGLPQSPAFRMQLITLANGRAIVPHGHDNLTSALLVLEGRVRCRHFDRLEDVGNDIIIRPTIDALFQPGDCSTASEYKDNIHWIRADKGPATLLSIQVTDVNPSDVGRTRRVYINPRGERFADGLIQAARIDEREAHRRFG